MSHAVGMRCTRHICTPTTVHYTAATHGTEQTKCASAQSAMSLKRSRNEWEASLQYSDSDSSDSTALLQFQRTAKLLMLDCTAEEDVDSDSDTSIAEQTADTVDATDSDTDNGDSADATDDAFYCHFCESSYQTLAAFDVSTEHCDWCSARLLH